MKVKLYNNNCFTILKKNKFLTYRFYNRVYKISIFRQKGLRK